VGEGLLPQQIGRHGHREFLGDAAGGHRAVSLSARVAAKIFNFTSCHEDDRMRLLVSDHMGFYRCDVGVPSKPKHHRVRATSFSELMRKLNGNATSLTSGHMKKIGRSHPRLPPEIYFSMTTHSPRHVMLMTICLYTNTIRSLFSYSLCSKL
jgi:hypothetical protein